MRTLLNGALFLAVCAAACALLGWLAPIPEVPGIYPKWNHFREHRDQLDVLFLGSSRFYHQIIPPQFDAAVEAAGGKVRSFNFGYDGMWPPESFYLLRQLLALRPARLKWVVVDLMDINTQLDGRNNSTLRMAYWHDWQHTRMAFREIMEVRHQWSDRLELLAQHGRLWFSQAINLGRGAELLDRRLAPKPPRKRAYTWEATAGYEAGPDHGMTGKIREGYLSTVERLGRQLPPAPVRPVFRDALRDLIADVRRAGAEPIFVIAPTINGRENFTEIPDGAAVFALNNPAEYPELFNPDHHYDAWHLNEKGAVDFTAILAKKFIGQTKP
ncbi:MAG: hypothetical protein QOE70_1698 [Chthoniobacter sp.]|jgi:hypothetical protein|nr:hypothetical protein [Chthoniobacter sp.]